MRITNYMSITFNTVSYVNAVYVPDNGYFGLRHVLLYGNTTAGRYKTDTNLLPSFWSPPITSNNDKTMI